MAQINVTNLSFCYDGSYDPVFQNVSFALDTQWRLGFTGRNGRGKTTFLHLLMGKYEHEGTISAPVHFDYFPFAVSDQRKRTGDVVDEICADYQPWQLSRELSLLEVGEEVLARPFETLSNGEQTKVLLAALFLKPNHFLLIDEPTNHLDMRAREIVGAYLRMQKGFILVSHDRSFLDHCIDHILSINKTSIDVQTGNFSSWWHNKQLRDAYEMQENRRLQKDVAKLSAAAKRTAAWSDQVEKTKYQPLDSGLRADRGFIGHKAAKMMKRSKAIEDRRQKALEEKSKLLKNIEHMESLAIKQLTYHANPLLSFEDVSISYDDRIVCENINFAVNRGERIAMQGKNGCGKTSLLKLALGQQIHHTGRVLIGSRLVCSYVSQETDFLRGSLQAFARESGIDLSLFQTILRKLDFSREQFDVNMQDFSQGQKKKVLIAQSLCQPAHLTIWDEPLNYIDVYSRMQIEALLQEGQPTMLFVEHDSAFVQAIATKTLVLSSD